MFIILVVVIFMNTTPFCNSRRRRSSSSRSSSRSRSRSRTRSRRSRSRSSRRSSSSSSSSNSRVVVVVVAVAAVLFLWFLCRQICDTGQDIQKGVLNSAFFALRTMLDIRAFVDFADISFESSTVYYLGSRPFQQSAPLSHAESKALNP